MEAKLTREMTILPSICDREAKLSIPDLFAQFMDVATLHAEELGVGAEPMIRRGLFWITVKTKVHILRRPRLLETVTVSTRPLVPERVRAIREYRLEKDGELLAEGKTEWAVLETATGRPRHMDGVFESGLELAKDPAYTAPFARILPDFAEAEELGSGRVRSTDIDLGGHMNNAAYPRALFGAFAVRELREKPVRCVDLIFRAPCHEGDLLSFYKKEEDGRFDVRMARGEETVLLGQITF